jgi:hypothetical protein
MKHPLWKLKTKAKPRKKPFCFLEDFSFYQTNFLLWSHRQHFSNLAPTKNTSQFSPFQNTKHKTQNTFKNFTKHTPGRLMSVVTETQASFLPKNKNKRNSSFLNEFHFVCAIPNKNKRKPC